MRWQPADAAEVTGPGTARTGRFIAAAACAVADVPERSAASTTSVARPSAAISAVAGEEPLPAHRLARRCSR